ncbi:hypothetical protein FPV67DRAFT_1670482 [Lyophyllum atratum]|nr:hypothetical protein FPV67DRAFT_1670482 [Lyophyllum atratum]
MNLRHAAPSYYATAPSYIAPPSDTMLQPRPAGSMPESRQLKEFLRSQAKLHNISEEQLRQTCVDEYGSPQRAMELIQAAEAHDAASIAQAFPHGVRPKMIGRKPIPGEDDDVQIAELRDGVWVRTWGGDVASQGCYCFDFVKRRGRHIIHTRRPSNIKVFSEANAWMPSAQVLSIEESLNKAEAQSPQLTQSFRMVREEYGDDYKPDPEWETYIVHQGIRLCFKQAGQEDVFVDIPRRTTTGRTLTFQPWP